MMLHIKLRCVHALYQTAISHIFISSPPALSENSARKSCIAPRGSECRTVIILPALQPQASEAIDQSLNISDTLTSLIYSAFLLCKTTHNTSLPPPSFLIHGSLSALCYFPVLCSLILSSYECA